MGILIKGVLAVLPGAVARECDIYIEDGSILSIDEAPEGFSPDLCIDGTGKLMIPGLVNAHTHAYMTLFRNRADDMELHRWLSEKIMPLEAELKPEEAYWSSLLACMEMIRGGTTCYLDMHMFPGKSVMAAMDSKMRAVISRGLSGGANDIDGGKRRLSEAVSEISDFSGISKVSFMLAPHAPYTCDEEYLHTIADTAKELGVGINTHLSESQGEVQQVYNTHNCSPVELYDRCGLLNEKTVAAHCVHLTTNDIDIISHRCVSVAVNSASNLKLGNGIAPVKRLMNSSVNICLGTDSSASNNNLSILRELELMTLLHKGISADPCAVTAAEGLHMATKNGARALGLEDVIGEIRVGYKADLAIFDIKEPGMIPLGDPVSAICYSSAGLRADTVLVDGHVILSKGEFVAIDADKVYFEIGRACRRLGL